MTAETIQQIYDAYPLHVGHRKALTAIERACERAPAESLLGLTIAFRTATDKWPVPDRQYIPHPATWFNQGRYADDQTAWKAKPNPLTAAEQKRLALENMHTEKDPTF